jgi:hypothetical protein
LIVEDDAGGLPGSWFDHPFSLYGPEPCATVFTPS